MNWILLLIVLALTGCAAHKPDTVASTSITVEGQKVSHFLFPKGPECVATPTDLSCNWLELYEKRHPSK